MSQKISAVSSKAQEAFWAVVAKEFPTVKNRNFNPEETREFNEACEQAIYDWVRENYPSGVERYSLLM
ncbi:MAG: hypothetical protein D4S01_09135 [Dehalococcoidia bacterium]|nr:MAG: hypothetical protein D4S01_09135 [Dehalococcoidia bacterium]